MKKNMGNTDKLVRLVVAAVVLALFLFDVIDGVLAIVLLAVSGIFVLTSLVSFCPLYTIFGIKTCQTKQ
jgi:hypothetical protein